MKAKIKEFGLLVLLIFTFSYIFNFIWEAFHAVFLFNGHNFSAIKYIPMIGYVSMMDGFLVLGLYLGVSLLWRDLLWIKNMNKKHTSMMLVTGLIAAGTIEYRAIFILKKWSYNPLMPTILNMGVSPLVQLSTTGILAVWLTRELLYKKGIYHER